MTARNPRRRPYRKTKKRGKEGRTKAWGHRESTAGRILPPIDVTSKNGIAQLLKLIKLGPFIIILVYADWCGHCHQFMPHFDRASKNRDRSVQVAKINEKMLPSVKKAMQQYNQSAENFEELEGYPSVYVLDNEGRKQTMIEPVKSTESMTRVMNELGNAPLPSPTESEMEQPVEVLPPTNVATSIGSIKKRNSVPKITSMNSSVTPDFIVNATSNSETEKNAKAKSVAANNAVVNNAVVNNAVANNVAANNAAAKNEAMNRAVSQAMANANLGEEEGVSAKSPSVSMPAVSMPVVSSPSTPTKPSTPKEMEQQAEKLASFETLKGATSRPPIMIPPAMNDDLETIRNPRSMMEPKARYAAPAAGGSLYAALSQSAYTLAPPAALLATAALMMKRRTRKMRRTRRRS